MSRLEYFVQPPSKELFQETLETLPSARMMTVRFFANGLIPPEQKSSPLEKESYLAQASEHGIIPSSYSRLEIDSDGKFSTSNYYGNSLFRAPARTMRSFVRGGKTGQLEVYIHQVTDENFREFQKTLLPELLTNGYHPLSAHIPLSIRGEHAEDSLFLGYYPHNPGLWLVLKRPTAEQISVFDPWVRTLREKYHEEQQTVDDD